MQNHSSNVASRIAACFSILLVCLGAPSVFGQDAVEAEKSKKELIRFERQSLTSTYFSEGVAVGDINGDDHLDIVYGPYWFAGPDFTNKVEIYPAKPQPMEAYADNFFSWIYDFDRDGANDIFVVGFPGTAAYVYQNPGQGKGEWKKHEVFDWVSNESPQLIQLVGDERPELVCTRDGFFGFATIDWEKPFATWKFHAISEKVTADRFGHGLGIGDINSDGRLDIIHAGGWYEQPNENALNGRWRPHAAKFSGSYGGAEMFAYDVDGDGDADVITSEAAHDYGLAWYEQKPGDDGEPTFVRQLIMGEHPSDNKYGVLFTELHSVQLFDINGDGLKDIITGKTYYSHHQQSPMWDAGAVVYWFELKRGENGVDWIPHQIDGQAGIGRQVTVADINQDGLLDVATGGMLGSTVLLQTRQAVTPEEYAAAQPKLYSGPKPRSVTNAQGLRGPKAETNSDGRVPGAIEGEELNATTSAGTAAAQPMGGFPADHWSGDSQLWWTGAKPGDTLTLELDVFKEVEAIEMALTCARDYGIVEISLDGKPLGNPIDLFNAEVITTGLLEFKTPGLNQGKYKLTFEIVGANRQAAKAYMFGLDFLRFRSPGESFETTDDAIKPTSSDGRELNLDFESGTLADWTAEGNAFENQPVAGDRVAARRNDSRSRHHGEYWIGGFEHLGDAPKGRLTSAPFKVTANFASFYVGGGNTEATRVELWAVGDEKPFYKISGRQVEDLSRIVVDMNRVKGREVFIRLVDASSDGWGHINFDHFRLHQESPGPVTPQALTLVADDYPHAGLSAEEAAKAMKVPEGFEVTVLAAEPDVKQPIAMTIDDRGRTWIAEAYEYPQRASGDSGRDRILIFEDTTGDGKFDSRKVFYEGLNLVSGIEVGFGGVWVGAAPYLMYIPDANGDDVADGKPQVLLDGWGFEDTHETLNTFCWGPDGWLYGCHGVFTHARVGKPGTPDAKRIPLNAGVWRYHPLRHEFEVFAHGTSNPWGVDFNEHGEAFVTACVIPHLYHMISGARYQRQAGQHFNAHTYADIPTIADHLHYLGANPHAANGKSDEAGGGHAHAGAMIYQGGVWPKRYHGALFMNNIHGQRLNTDLLVPDGSGYVGSHGPDFLLTGDVASQVLNMRYGPDGQVIMIDWYDMQACHRPQVEVHDRSNGRIYKISYGKTSPVKVNLAKLTDIELAELCLHDNDWYVRHARRVLQERAAQRKIAPEAIERVTDIATSHPDDTRRLRAIWTRHAIGTFDQSLLTKLFNDASPHVRGWALRLQMEQQRNLLNAQQLETVAKMAANDSSSVVRRAITSAVDKLPVKDRWDILPALVGHAADAEDHNLPLMYWYAMEPLAEADPDRALALGMAAGETHPQLREFMLRRVAGSGGEAAIARLVAALEKNTLNDSSAAIQLTFLEAIRTALAGQRQAAMPARWSAIAAKLDKSPNEQVRLLATALGVTFGDANALSTLRSKLADNAAPEAERLEALGALLGAKDPKLAESLLQLLKLDSPSELRVSAIRGLAQYESASATKTLIDSYSEFDAAERRAAIATLSSRVAGATALLNAIADGQIAAADLTADLARQIEYLGDAKVQKLLAENWGQVRESSADRAKLIEAAKKLVERTDLPKPDLELGRAIYSKTCQRCHVLYGVGEKLGPDLTGSNRANLDYLLENIVDPSAVMAHEYRQSIFLTDSGQVITGIVREENERAVTIQTAEETVVLPKDEIEQRQASEQSMMPDNQLTQFSEHEVRSLLAYLRGKQQNPMLASPENASLIFNGQDLVGWNGNRELWSVDNGELVGKSNGLEENEFLVSELSASDFKLTLEVKLVRNEGNSGIQIRSSARDDGSVEGFQADVGAGWWGKLYEEHGRGLLWDESGEQHVKLGEWNRYEIEADGTRVRTWINGKPCVNLDDAAGKRRGIFALQLHSGGPTEVRFRNIQLEVK